MLRVPIDNAKSGMTLAMPVRNPQAPERYLLSSGYDLNDPIIERLKHTGVREVVVRYPGLEVLGQFIDPQVLERRAETSRMLGAVLQRAQNHANAKLEYDRYLRQVAALVEQVLQNPSALLFIDEVAQDAPWLLEHSSNVAYLSLLMGLKLDWYLMKQRKRLPPKYAREVTNLGVGAMLHDVGMMKLDPAVFDRFRQTGDTSDPAWRAHVRLGYELVRGQIDPTAAVVVLDHHQHFDGSGFPARRSATGERVALSGEGIHIFARITAVADMFSWLREPCEGQREPTIRAIRKMLNPPYVHWFDPHVLRAFLTVVPPYAPLKPVRLSDGNWAMPIDHSADDPCRPTVQLIPGPEPRDAAAQSQTPQIVDLREQPDLHVAYAEGQDVSDDNFPVPELLEDTGSELARAYTAEA